MHFHIFYHFPLLLIFLENILLISITTLPYTSAYNLFDEFNEKFDQLSDYAEDKVRRSTAAQLNKIIKKNANNLVNYNLNNLSVDDGDEELYRSMDDSVGEAENDNRDHQEENNINVESERNVNKLSSRTDEEDLSSPSSGMEKLLNVLTPYYKRNIEPLLSESNDIELDENHQNNNDDDDSQNDSLYTSLIQDNTNRVQRNPNSFSSHLNPYNNQRTSNGNLGSDKNKLHGNSELHKRTCKPCSVREERLGRFNCCSYTRSNDYNNDIKSKRDVDKRDQSINSNVLPSLDPKLIMNINPQTFPAVIAETNNNLPNFNGLVNLPIAENRLRNGDSFYDTSKLVEGRIVPPNGNGNDGNTVQMENIKNPFPSYIDNMYSPQLQSQYRGLMLRSRSNGTNEKLANGTSGISSTTTSSTPQSTVAAEQNEAKSCPEVIDSNNATSILERILEELQLIKQAKETSIPEGMPCDIKGSWNSEMIGLRFDINSTNGNDLTIKLYDHLPPKLHTLMDRNWTCNGYAMHIKGGPFSMTAMKVKETILSSFSGMCKTCGGIDTIFGTWNFVHPANDCRNLQMSIESKRDVFRREMLFVKKKIKLGKLDKETTTNTSKIIHSANYENSPIYQYQ